MEYLGLAELFFLAVGLSMDASAVAVCMGLTMPKAGMSKALTVGLYFGFFQALMPAIGYLAASFFADIIVGFDHWIAFALLSFLGGRMIAGSFEKVSPGDGAKQNKQKPDEPLTPARMLPPALATSIDALAVGISLAFLRVDIAPAALFIGITTFILSVAGVKIGSAFGSKLKARAELFGGIILIGIGVKILIEHLSA